MSRRTHGDHMTIPHTSVRYAEHLMRQYPHALGYLPRQALVEYHGRGQIDVETEQGDDVGAVIWYDGRRGRPPRLHCDSTKIIVLCVQDDARRLKHATHMLGRAIGRAIAKGHRSIHAWVAEDLESNAYWQAAGFICPYQRIGGSTRGRLHNLWYLDLDTLRPHAQTTPPLWTPARVRIATTRMIR